MPLAAASSLATRATVSIVPSVGFITALYAPSTPFSSACTRSFASAVFLPCSALEKPRNSRLEITPELPRAPRSMALAVTCAAFSTVQSSGRFRSSVRAAPMVMPMLVPVSPSGTGKTFSSSTLARRLERLFAPEMMLFFKVKPVIISFLHLKQCFGRRPGARTGTLQTMSST